MSSCSTSFSVAVSPMSLANGTGRVATQVPAEEAETLREETLARNDESKRNCDMFVPDVFEISYSYSGGSRQ